MRSICLLIFFVFRFTGEGFNHLPRTVTRRNSIKIDVWDCHVTANIQAFTKQKTSQDSGFITRARSHHVICHKHKAKLTDSVTLHWHKLMNCYKNRLQGLLKVKLIFPLLVLWCPQSGQGESPCQEVYKDLSFPLKGSESSVWWGPLKGLTGPKQWAKKICKDWT